MKVPYYKDEWWPFYTPGGRDGEIEITPEFYERWKAAEAEFVAVMREVDRLVKAIGDAVPGATTNAGDGDAAR